MILLGTGTSVGVPALGCRCAVCTGGDPLNRRTRCSAILGLPQGNLLIDTAPDFHQQMVREKLGIVHSVLYTHEHADHIFGMDDLRLFQFFLGKPVPVFCNSQVNDTIRRVFDYAFSDKEQTHIGARPAIDITLIDNEPFSVLGNQITPIQLGHGPQFDVLGFRIGDIAYCTDCKSIPDESKERLQNLDILIISALRYDPHPTHKNIDEAIETARELGAKRTILTHMSCRIDYQTISKELPPGVEAGYDGMQFDLRL